MNHDSLENLPSVTEIINNEPQIRTMGLPFTGQWVASLHFCLWHYLWNLRREYYLS